MTCFLSTPHQAWCFSLYVHCLNPRSNLVETKYRWALTYNRFNLVLTIVIGKQHVLYLVKLSLNIEFCYFPWLWMNGRILSTCWTAEQATFPRELQDGDVLWYSVLLSPGIP